MGEYFLSIRLFLVVLAIVVVPFAFTGCGDSDNGSETGSAATQVNGSRGGEEEASPEADGEGDSDGGPESGGEAEPEGGSPSKAEFIAQADALCKESLKALESEFKAFKADLEEEGASNFEKAIEKFVGETYVPHYEGLIEELEALGTPNGDEQQIGEFLAAFQQGLDQANRNPAQFISSRGRLGKTPKLAGAYG